MLAATMRKGIGVLPLPVARNSKALMKKDFLSVSGSGDSRFLAVWSRPLLFLDELDRTGRGKHRGSVHPMRRAAEQSHVLARRRHESPPDNVVSMHVQLSCVLASYSFASKTSRFHVLLYMQMRGPEVTCGSGGYKDRFGVGSRRGGVNSSTACTDAPLLQFCCWEKSLHRVTAGCRGRGFVTWYPNTGLLHETKVADRASSLWQCHEVAASAMQLLASSHLSI